MHNLIPTNSKHLDRFWHLVGPFSEYLECELVFLTIANANWDIYALNHDSLRSGRESTLGFANSDVHMPLAINAHVYALHTVLVVQIVSFPIRLILFL